VNRQAKPILLLILFAVYLTLLVSVILFKLPFYSPPGADERAINLIPLAGSFDENGAFVLRELVYNILLFVPLGIYLSTFKDDLGIAKKLLTSVCLTVAFEVLQYIFALGRSDITDVIGNTLGALIGVSLYAILARIFKERTTAIVSVVAAIATVYVAVRFAHLFYLSHFVMMRPGL
jgi:glycopeptide antibiotics resistance protein